MTFTLTIETGNDAMQTFPDIAGALLKLATLLRGYGEISQTCWDGGKIRDLNGNSVGRWEMSK